MVYFVWFFFGWPFLFFSFFLQSGWWWLSTCHVLLLHMDESAMWFDDAILLRNVYLLQYTVQYPSKLFLFLQSYVNMHIGLM